jgi:hypothetical protein
MNFLVVVLFWIQLAVSIASVPSLCSINKVFNVNQHANNSLARILEYRSHKALPKELILPTSNACKNETAHDIAALFLKWDLDGSSCPKEDWLVAMSKADTSPKLIINIGVNKGYNLALWMNIFQSQLRFTTKDWRNEIVSYVGHNGDFCGACKDCEAHYPFDQVAPSDHLTMLALDLNCGNLEGIDSMFQTISKKVNTENVTLFTSCSGASNENYNLSMRKCSYGWEVCGISSARSHLKETVTVPVVTVNELMKSFLNYLIEDHPGDRRSHHHNYFHKLVQTYFHSSENKTYHPLIDLLLVDTEGNDYLVLKGSIPLLKSGAIRVVIFEYHRYLPWSKLKLEDAKNDMDSYGYDCYFQGSGRLWKITGENCWVNIYEFHHWSNIMCVRREDIWYQTLQPFVVTGTDGKQVFVNGQVVK